jgi:hypothetical protein
LINGWLAVIEEGSREPKMGLLEAMWRDPIRQDQDQDEDQDQEDAEEDDEDQWEDIEE